jgi:hypothetical protein
LISCVEQPGRQHMTDIAGSSRDQNLFHAFGFLCVIGKDRPVVGR